MTLFTEDQINNAAQSFGYSPNSSTQASQVYDSLNDARISGALQGLGLIAGAAASPAGLLNQIMSSYGDGGKTTTPIDTAFSTAADKLGITNILGENNKTLDTAGKVIDFAQRGPGALLNFYDPSRRGVLNRSPVLADKSVTTSQGLSPIRLGKSERSMIEKGALANSDKGFGITVPPNTNPDTTASIIAALNEPSDFGPYTAKNNIEAPEQNMFEKGISSVVDFFGGPQAASRNNLDTSFDSGNDQPERRRVVQAAVPTPSPVKEDEELTGIKGLLARRKPVASRRDSNKFSKLLLSSLYPNQNINLG